MQSVDLEKGIRSADFSIGEHVYKDVMKHALRAYFISARGSRRNRSLQAGPGRTRRAISDPARMPNRARGLRGGRRPRR